MINTIYIKKEAVRPRYFFMCVGIGACLGFGMILTHYGPGIRPLPPRSTPAYRNAQRAALITQLVAALQQYKKDHGSLPVTISEQATQTCTSYGANCVSKHLLDLSFLTTAGNYLEGVPQDPLGGDVLWGSGFSIAKLPDGSLRISATKAELGKVIESTIKL